MKVEALKKCKYQHKGYCPGDKVDLPSNIAKSWISCGIAVECVQKKEETKKANNFTPVEETAVIEPVQEVKEKPKRRKRKKKAE